VLQTNSNRSSPPEFHGRLIGMLPSGGCFLKRFGCGCKRFLFSDSLEKSRFAQRCACALLRDEERRAERR
jgi:hypothetical protein